MSDKYGERWDTRKRGESLRPYRIWDANKRHNVRWRCFTDKEHALDGAWLELRTARIGQSYEVYDIRTMKLIAQYTKRISGVVVQKG